MHKLLLTQDAFNRFYGSSRLIVMTADLFVPLAAMIPQSLDVLLLDDSGALCISDETISADAQLIAPVGAPVGLLGFVVSEETEANASAWSNWSHDQTGRTAPPIWSVKPGDDAQTLVYLMEAAFMDADSSKRTAAVAQTDLAILRRDFERSLINIEKARRIIRGAGYGTRYSTLTAPPGERSVGPGGLTNPLEPFSIRFGLPVDAAGFVGISLHCEVETGQPAQGRLALQLIRSVDARILGRAQIDFSALTAGWNYFELTQQLQRSFGDAELVLEWAVERDGAIPRISVTNGEPDRCGAVLDDHNEASGMTGKILPAMQIWSGFAPGELADDHHFTGTPKEHRRAAIGTLISRTTAIAVNDEASSDFAANDPTTGWVQTHLQDGNPAGLLFKNCVPPSSQAVTISCETAHAAGPICFYLVVVGSAERLGQEVASSFFESAKKGGKTSGFDAEAGVAWSIQAVSPGVRTDIEVDMSRFSSISTSQSLLLLVESATDKIEYGWCRWHDVSVELDTVRGHSVAFSMQYGHQPPAQRMRSVKFPEIAERLEFLAGRAKLQKLTESLGFSPMIVADDNGTLQTHPLLEEVSAVLYRSGATAGTTRVACDVETAHERAPVFMYVLALIPSETPDKQEIFKGLVSNLSNRNFLATRGYDESRQIHYVARRLPALQIEAVSVDLDAPLETDHDIIIAALPVHEIVSYGWCRWLSLSVASTVDAHPQINLLAPDEQEASNV